MMFLLTKQKNNIESGTYATYDSDGSTIVQFFIDKDDAITYNDHLHAIGYELHVTETPDENIDKMCDILGFAYTIVEPGDIVLPRTETLMSDFGL
jgi:hypothetical protein